jgi:hypothetical protein
VRRAAALVALVSVGAMAVVAGKSADAQRLDPRRATRITVGNPVGFSPFHGADARRSGRASAGLPHASPLRIAWRKPLGLAMDQSVLAIEDDVVAAITARGDVHFLDGADGDEIVRVTVGAGSVGPATSTSDGTVVFLTAAGDAVGARRTSASPRFVRRVSADRGARAAPLGLSDGGAVLATPRELIVIDAEGSVRARAAIPEAPAAPLLSDGTRILSVSAGGTVHAWTPGSEIVRVGSFGAPTDGGAALASPTTLLAIIEGNHFVELDLAHGLRTTRAVAPQGIYLGPPSVRREARGDGGAALEGCVLALTTTRTFTACVGAAGKDTRSNVGPHAVGLLADGGAAPLVAPPHVAPLVDDAGAAAFATPEGQVGVVTPQGAVEVLGETPCPRTGRSAGIAGLASAGRAAFYVTCESGVVLKVTGPGADAPSATRRRLRKPAAATSAAPPRPAPAEPPEEEPEIEEDDDP